MTTEQWVKIAKGAGISIASALLAYATVSVLPMLQSSGGWMAALVPVFGTLINFARKWLDSQKVSE